MQRMELKISKKLRLKADRWNVSIELGEEEWDCRVVGLGWWRGSSPLTLHGWFFYLDTYYDGRWFAWRVGPLFYNRGPY